MLVIHFARNIMESLSSTLFDSPWLQVRKWLIVHQLAISNDPDWLVPCSVILDVNSSSSSSSLIDVLVINSIELLNKESISSSPRLASPRLLPLRFPWQKRETRRNIPSAVLFFFVIVLIVFLNSIPTLVTYCCSIISKSNKTRTPNWHSLIYSITCWTNTDLDRFHFSPSSVGRRSFVEQDLRHTPNDLLLLLRIRLRFFHSSRLMIWTAQDH